jgi:hypothetical protein
VVVDLSEDDERELNVRLNANTGGWDFELLANEWIVEDLVEWGLEGIPFDIEEEQIEKEDKQIETCEKCGKEI